MPVVQCMTCENHEWSAGPDRRDQQWDAESKTWSLISKGFEKTDGEVIVRGLVDRRIPAAKYAKENNISERCK